MRILIVVNTLCYGGAEKQAVADANSLAAEGNDVTLGCHMIGDLARRLSPEVKLYRIGSKNVIVAALLLFMHLLSNRYDIIHSHMFWAERVSIIPGKLTRHRVVFNEHGLGLWRKWYHVVTMRLISMLADKVVTSCQENYRVRRKQEKLDPDKMVVIYNSVEENSKGDLSSESLGELHDGKFIIGYAGRFNAVKRLELFLNIAERLKDRIKDFKIVLLGDGDLRRRLEREISGRGLEEFFHMPGFVLEVSQYYRTFDVFVLPSKIEGFSLALLEAGAASVPLIAFDVGGNSEIIVNGVNGYTIPNNDIDTLMERIIYLREHEGFRRKMGMAAHRLIEGRFSVSRRTDDLQRLYRSLQ
ncbi:MAG: glycosyltransferase [candidate division WOR-3 bacterium]|nr:glycosyltransferase [candidate division WOR-3 bacterium]